MNKLTYAVLWYFEEAYQFQQRQSFKVSTTEVRQGLVTS